LKPNDELIDIGVRNKYGGINQDAIQKGLFNLDKNGDPIFYRSS
jgi:hypothetical protein